MPAKTIHSDGAPKAIGPYSQAIETPGGLVFLSGQIPLDPETMQVVEGDVAAQTDRVMRNLRAVLEAAGLGWESVAKTTIYLADMADYSAVNEVYERHLTLSDGKLHAPARAAVQVAGLPRAVRVEIDAVAVRS